MKLSRVVAREWLVLLACTVSGLVALPSLLWLAAWVMAVDRLPGYGEFMSSAYESFDSGFGILAAIPYVVVQLVRSIIWAVRTIRS